jgi:hypothetical protein
VKVKILSLEHFFNTLKRRTNSVVKSSANAQEAIERITKEVIATHNYDFPIDEQINKNPRYFVQAWEAFDYAIEEVQKAFPGQNWKRVDEDDEGEEWKKKKKS